MPVADILVDVAANHAILTFMDGYSMYNQIYVAGADTHNIAFMCTRALFIYERLVIPFCLRNAGATNSWITEKDLVSKSTY